MRTESAETAVVDGAAATRDATDATDPVVASEPKPARFGYHPALDGIRAVALLAILGYHDNYSWAKGAFLSVDTFFLLSGFLITTLLVLEFRRSDTIRLGEFWARRGRRLLPALLLVCAFLALYTHLVVLPWERESVRLDNFASLFYVANWRFIADKLGYFELFSAASPMRHMWTLAIEEQYYLVWPLVVFACLRVGRGSVRVLLAVSAIGIAASVWVMRSTFVVGNPVEAYYRTDARAHTILVGAVLALLMVSWTPGRQASRALAWVAVPATVLMFFLWYEIAGTTPGYYRGGSFVYAVLVAVIVAGALQKGPVASVFAIAPLVWIGRLSYGLYLWHWPINVWLVPSRIDLPPTQLNLLRLALTFFAATVSFYLIELPIRERRWKRPAVTAAVFVPAIGVVALLIAMSATGAKEPPSYLWGYGDPLVCGEPRPGETREAIEAQHELGRLELPESVRDERILLVGDSSACSLWPGLRAVGDDAGVATDQGAVFGCGIASAEITTTRNEAVTPNSDRCHQLVDSTQRQALARSHPTVVIWMSVWEKSDLVVDDKTVVAGTSEGEREIMRRMDDAFARLTVGGARVVMVTVAAPAPNPAQSTETFDRAADDAGYQRLTELLLRFEARHDDKVTVVDLAEKVCPGGPVCPEVVEGLHARPDGRHFTPTAATWAARWLVVETFESDG